MNVPLEAPCDRSDLFRKPSEAAAEAAQRDLFEYFAPPQTTASAPPLAADVPPTETPDAAAAAGDEDVTPRDETSHVQTSNDQTGDDEPSRDQVWLDQTWHDQTWHDQTWHDQILAWPEESQDDEISPHEPETSDEIVPDEPGAPVMHPEVAALDEVSKANLRRFETTLNWLQSEVEACHLPTATPLPQIPGLPVVAPIIDRSTLDRTLHQAPPLPAWLRDLPAVPPPAPPPRDRVFWPRAIKVLVACAIAAPLSYHFAVTTSPLQKRLVEIAGMASLDSPLARVPTAVESAPEALAFASERDVETPALSTLVKVEPTNRSSPEVRTTEAAVETAAVPVPTADAPQVETPRVEAPRTEAPRVEAGDTGVITGQPVAVEDIGPAALPPATAAPVSTKTGEPRDVKLLIEQGRQFFDVGDLVAARILFLRAANAGDATAAVAMGATYDPVVLANRGVLGPAADLDHARRWYERAKEMGSPEGPRRLEMLANR